MKSHVVRHWTIPAFTIRATVEVVIFEPGEKDSAHRHTGPVVGYVLEGKYEHALDDEPIKAYKAGDTFYEPSGSVQVKAASCCSS